MIIFIFFSAAYTVLYISIDLYIIGLQCLDIFLKVKRQYHLNPNLSPPLFIFVFLFVLSVVSPPHLLYRRTRLLDQEKNSIYALFGPKLKRVSIFHCTL